MSHSYLTRHPLKMELAFHWCTTNLVVLRCSRYMNCDPFEILEQRLGQESNYVKVQR